MTQTQTQTEDLEPVEQAVAADVGGSIRTMAISLWVVVGALLGYGVLQTAVKASALFAG